MSWFCPKKEEDNNGETHKEIDAEDQGVLSEADDLRYGERSIRGEYWKVDSMSYVHGKWETIFKRKKEIEARYLRIQAPSHNIPRQINHIAFPNLIALYLEQNKIASVECFITLNAPNLVDLGLKANFITRIRSLRKCGFKLDHLLLDQNPIPELAGLSEINFHKTVQKKYVTSYTYQSHSARQCYPSIHNISQLVKAQPKAICQSFALDQTSERHLNNNKKMVLNFNQISSLRARQCTQIEYVYHELPEKQEENGERDRH